MMGKTHLVFGVAAGLWVALMLETNLPATALVVGAAAGGSLLPDIDHPNGMLRRRMGILGWGFNVLPHRGPTHTLLVLGALTLGLALLVSRGDAYAQSAFFGFVFGYASHLLGDMLTVEGIPLFFPLYYGDIRLLPRFLSVHTGGIVEWILSSLALVGAMYLLYLVVT